jgi:hypothetical protein
MTFYRYLPEGLPRALGLTLALALAVRPLPAQGVTGGAVQGTVSDSAGTAIEDATVVATNVATGERWQVATRSQGRYAVEHLTVGGPYRVEVRALGFAPAERHDVVLSQGRRVWIDFALTPSAVTLEELSVTGRATELDPARTGPSLTLPESTIARLPLDGRDFSRFAVLSPFVSPSADGELSFAGQHRAFNSTLVDGTTYNSLRGGGADGFGGIPGTQREYGFFAIVPEALQEIQIASAPYDVRYGNFTGGLISAVTRSGSNAWQGSLYGYDESPSLAGHNPDGTRVDPFTRQEIGLTLGGPIVRDRVAFFLQAGLNRNRYPQTTPSPADDGSEDVDSAIGISSANALRFRGILRETYGVDAGEFGGIDRSVGIGRVFAKVTAQLGVNSRLEVSQSYLHESPRLADLHFPGFIAFSSGGAYDPNDVSVTRLEWTAAFAARWTNQATLALRSQGHQCHPEGDFIRLTVRLGDADMEAGQQRFCAGGDNRERVWELTDNLELAAGAHHFTLGTHNELVRMADVGVMDAGQWFFTSLEALESEVPSAYERAVAGPDAPADATTRFRVTQLGLYLQDQWTPNARLTVTGGIRMDLPLLEDAPREIPLLLDELRVSSAVTPSGTPIWSPRIGVNYDLSGRGTAFLRGGLGLFSGRPAYTWLGNVYGENGSVGLGFVRCEGDQLPALTLDPSAPPAQCADAGPPRPLVSVFDPAFRYPRDLKISAGADVALPWGLVGTADVLFTAGVDQFAVRDLNLGPPVGVAVGEAGRVLYGTFGEGGPVPNHRSEAFDAVTEVTNRSGDRAYSLALQLRKRLGHGGEVLASYSYTDARNRADMPALSGRGLLGLTVLDGTWEQPALRPALWSLPHKVTIAATAGLPLGLRLGLTWLGISGAPVSYVVVGDANADGFDNPGAGRYNDAVYLPLSPDDITLAEGERYSDLDRFIRSQPCLQRQRGRLARRNSCRNPWSSRLDVRLSGAIPSVVRGQSIEMMADLFNVLNLLDRDWGQVRGAVEEFGAPSVGNRVGLLELVGYDQDRGRGRYHILAPRAREVAIEQTRWRARLGLRYVF